MKLSTVMYQRCEIVLHSAKTYENPFLDVNVDAVFTHEDGTRIALPGFWNGENEWKVRFSAEKSGIWRYRVTCTDLRNYDLFDEGEIEAVPCKNPATDLEKHGYVRLAQGKRYLTYADGTPFLYLADTHWQMPDYERLHECSCPGCTCGSQFKHLVKDRKKKGFTVYQTYFSSSRVAVEKPGTPGWWTDTTFTKINPQAFNESMDEMMEYLASQGLTVALGFGLHIGSIQGYRHDPAPLLAFARYCVARYACYPVLWITGQEVTMDAYVFKVWRQVGQLVADLDGFHRPNGAHMYVHEMSDPRSQVLDAQPWHEWWTLQAGHGGVDHIQNRSYYQGYYENSPKPFMETECQYEDIYCGKFVAADAPRIGAWQAMLSGAAGCTYGVTGVWAMQWNDTDDRGWLSYSPEPWYIGMNKPGSTQFGYLRKFFEYVNWTTLTPSFDHKYGKFEMRKCVSIAHRDQDVFIFYFFASFEESGKLTGLKPGVRYQARWYDPIHGKFVDLPDVVTETGEIDIPERPSKRDWVLLLNCVDLGAYESWVYPTAVPSISASDAKLGEEYAIKLTVSSEDPEHPAANMLDGKPDTYWQGFAPRTSQTIIADLGEIKPLGYLNLISLMEDMRYLHYRLYGSADGENWELITERPVDWVAVGGPYPVFYDPLKGSYRYVKFFLNSCYETPQLKLSKFAIFAKKED